MRINCLFSIILAKAIACWSVSIFQRLHLADGDDKVLLIWEMARQGDVAERQKPTMSVNAIIKRTLTLVHERRICAYIKHTFKNIKWCCYHTIESALKTYLSTSFTPLTTSTWLHEGFNYFTWDISASADFVFSSSHWFKVGWAQVGKGDVTYLHATTWMKMWRQMWGCLLMLQGPWSKQEHKALMKLILRGLRMFYP